MTKNLFMRKLFSKFGKKILDESTTLVEQSKKKYYQRVSRNIIITKYSKAEKPYQKSLYNKLSQKMKMKLLI